jgi:hypothetical protein
LLWGKNSLRQCIVVSDRRRREQTPHGLKSSGLRCPGSRSCSPRGYEISGCIATGRFGRRIGPAQGEFDPFTNASTLWCGALAANRVLRMRMILFD